MSELKSHGGMCHVPQTAGGQEAEVRVGSVELGCRAWGACPGWDMSECMLGLVVLARDRCQEMLI